MISENSLKIGLSQQTITWSKIRQAGGQVHYYYSRTGTLNKNQSSLTGWGLFVLTFQCLNNNELALKHGGSCDRLLISFPDLLWTKPKARSGKERKFVFLDWLLHLTHVQSPLWKFTRFSAANFLQIQVLTWKFPRLGKRKADKKRREEKRFGSTICHSG